MSEQTIATLETQISEALKSANAFAAADEFEYAIDSLTEAIERQHALIRELFAIIKETTT